MDFINPLPWKSQNWTRKDEGENPMNMMTIAFKNFKRNFSFYALYLLSVSLVITVYFAFTSFSMNQVMLEKISENGRVESMCNIISAFLIIFVVFYMSYSNRFFLRRRTKELGIYALLGYQKSAILSLLISENILITGSALITGIILGAIMHKGIVYGTTILLKLSINHAQIPFFQFGAIRRTIIFLCLIMLVMAISNACFLMKTSLMDLVRFEKSAEKRMKFHKIPAIAGAVFITAGYGLALDIVRKTNSIWFTVGFYPITLLSGMSIVTGTVLFIASFLPFYAQKSKQRQRTFYTETKIVTVPNFVYRIRSNAKTLIMLTLLSAGTLTVCSVMALSFSYPVIAVDRIAPSELEFKVEKESQIPDVKLLIREYVPDSSVTFTQTELLLVTAAAKQLPAEYSLGSMGDGADSKKALRAAGFECISYSQYAALLQAQGRNNSLKKLSELQNSECILVKYQPNSDGSDETGSIYSLNIGSENMALTVRETTLDNPFSFSNSIGTLIVSDYAYGQIKSGGGATSNILSINGKALEDNEELFEKISRLLDESPYLTGHSHRVNEIMSANSSTFLLLGFLIVLFFIATGSILYFNNISAVSDSKADYEILSKMGYTDKKIKKIIKKQIFTFFVIPFLFGLTDCFAATVVYKTGLMQNLLGSTVRVYFPAMIAIALSALIYFIYYSVTVHTSCKTALGH